VILPASFPAPDAIDTEPESSVLDLPHEDLEEVRVLSYLTTEYWDIRLCPAALSSGVSKYFETKVSFDSDFMRKVGKIRGLLPGIVEQFVFPDFSNDVIGLNCSLFQAS
jgi:hypothetical protein